MKICILYSLLLLSLITVASCSPTTSSPAVDTRTPAVQRLESYLQALVDKDEDTLVQLTCADWEMNALLEFDAFGGVETELEGWHASKSTVKMAARRLCARGK
jgi:hypothetical protein